MPLRTAPASNASNLSSRGSPGHRMRELLDWTVVGLGIASLSIATAATLLTQASAEDAAQAVPQDDIVVTVLPEVL